jgi:hypothetical protein
MQKILSCKRDIACAGSRQPAKVTRVNRGLRAETQLVRLSSHDSLVKAVVLALRTKSLPEFVDGTAPGCHFLLGALSWSPIILPSIATG